MLLVVLLILLPRHVATVAFTTLLLMSVAGLGILYYPDIASALRHKETLRRVFLRPADERPVVRSVEEVRTRRLLMVAELFFITVFTVSTTETFWKNNPDQTLPGREVQWQVNTAYYAAQALREHGYIPLWNPWLEYGHPLIDNSQSFVMNPFSTVPSLLWGGIRGIKLSVGIYALLAAWGGWFLGYVLNLRSFGRVMLALLLLGKGNMLAMFGAGYFQLASAQAYLPWVIAGTLAILRNEGKRWPVALTALSLTLQFWGGSIWYSLPAALSMLFMAGFYLFYFPLRRTSGVGAEVKDAPQISAGKDTFMRVRLPPWYLYLKDNGLKPIARSASWPALRNLIFTAVLTLGLSAITLLPIWLQREYLGDHPDDKTAGWEVDLEKAIEQYYNGDPAPYEMNTAIGEAHFYFSFISPLWFLVIIFIFLPPVPGILHRESQSQTWRLWSVAIIMIVVMTLWGAGGNPVVLWLYEHVPLLAQWRFPARALGVASFWIGVLIAMRLDGLWRVIWSENWMQSPLRTLFIRGAQLFFALLLVVAGWSAAREVNKSWENFAGTVSLDQWKLERDCLKWLREQHPDDYLAVYQFGYDSVIDYAENHVVMWDIEADFEPLSIPVTLSHDLVMRTRPEYGIAWDRKTRRTLHTWGYEPVPGSPTPVDENHCLYRREGALDFAYTVPLSTLQTWNSPMERQKTFPAKVIQQLPDRIRVQAQGYAASSRVLVVQQLAHPGWEVTVDGEPAYLESVGGLLGVLLPRDNKFHTVEFAYRPPLVYRGAALSLFTCVFLILYLLRADRLLKFIWSKARRKE